MIGTTAKEFQYRLQQLSQFPHRQISSVTYLAINDQYITSIYHLIDTIHSGNHQDYLKSLNLIRIN